MLTRMTQRDWEIAVEVFRAARSKRGEPGHDDQRFLEALHYFTVHNITWRALPPEFGNWNSVWKRFWRLSQSGTFEAFFEALAATSKSAHLVRCSTPRSCGRMCPRRAQKGAGNPGARQIAWRLLDQDPSQDRLRRPSDRVPPDRRRGQRQP